VDGRAKDVVGLEEPGEDEEDQHDADGPAEDLQREGGGEGGMRERLCFAEDQTGDEGDSGGESEEENRIDDAVADGLVGLQEELGVFEAKEDGVKDSEEGEQAEEKSYGFGEFEQHAPGLGRV
jgi:hypothetical protein